VPAAVDLAVVGAGMAGTYVAYRAGLMHPDWSISLFERSDRIGGRLLSARPPTDDANPAELGGMRYRRDHPLVGGLVASLGLKTRPFDLVHDDNRYYFRGIASSAAKGAPIQGYRLEPSERGMTPAELLIDAFERIVPHATALTDDDWQIVKRDHTYQGLPLSEWTCRDALRSVLSAEAYQLIVDWIGYSAILGLRNAADAIPYVLAEMQPEAEDQVALVGGMDTLPRSVTDRFAAHGGEVRMDHALWRLERRTSHGTIAFRLDFENGASVPARRVVLALPRSALEALAARSSPLQSSEIVGLFGSVVVHDAAKLFLTYGRPWWRDAGVRGHRLTTDLPLRKVFYFDRTDAGLEPGTALLLASYTDTSDVRLWRELGGRTDGSATNGGPRTGEWDRHPASPAQIAAAESQLKVIHGVGEIPKATGAAFIDWGSGSLGGGWHFWRAGVRSTVAQARILQPDPASEIFVCGEAYSASQGWIEGALETADLVLERLA
jgi:monoamine oxidase